MGPGVRDDRASAGARVVQEEGERHGRNERAGPGDVPWVDPIKDQRTHKFGVIYHIPLLSKHGIWTMNLFEGHIVLKQEQEIFMCSRAAGEPGGSSFSNMKVLGLKYHTYSGFWNLRPFCFGTCTLRGRWRS